LEFGLFSNGHRAHTTAARTYDEDVFEIVAADQLGFQYAWVSEHHAEPIYMNQVDTISIPELLICKAAGLTRQIRMGPAVKIIHLQHPVDVATLAAVTDHVTNGRYIFGFGSGFANAYFFSESATLMPARCCRRVRRYSSRVWCLPSSQTRAWATIASISVEP
jgi:alkanesulfonate monooxygenase SsuD/methylene tetrahydromethanopterin reductase-like flavin-dependent oxidoreductase (luciferase family)